MSNALMNSTSIETAIRAVLIMTINEFGLTERTQPPFGLSKKQCKALHSVIKEWRRQIKKSKKCARRKKAREYKIGVSND